MLCGAPGSASLAAQTETGFHGAVETFQALPFSADRSLTDSRSALTGELAFRAGETAAFVSLSAEYNGISPERSGFSLGEAWLNWGAGPFSFRLGRQLVSWGVADGLILNDVVCPQNLTAYAGLDFAGSRLGVDGLRMRYSVPVLAAEFIWLPLFTPARLPADSRNPLYEIAYPAAAEINGTVLPVLAAANGPPRSITDGEYGLRFSFYTPALDFSFSGFYGWNDIPVTEKKTGSLPGQPSIPAVELIPRYYRTITAGADASIPLGEVLLRMEVAWIGGGRFDPSNAEIASALQEFRPSEPVERHNLKLLAGIDWNPSGWSLSAQYYEDLLPDAGSPDNGTARRWRKNALTLRIARGFFREILELSAWCYLDLYDFDTAGNVCVSYAFTDSLSLSLGSDFFGGGIDERGSYAAYTKLNCVWIKGIFRF
jgi:hypothetical protein